MGDTLESGPNGAVPEPIAHATTLPASPGSPNPEGRGLTAEHPGRYEFDRNRDSMRELGRGGLGRVLLAYDTHLGREVAWKEILPEARHLADTPSDGVTGTARFLREARVTGQLEHPSIVPVYELGSRADGTVYYTMKVVRGRTLREALDACGTLLERLRLLPQYASLCQAIAFAHSRGVIHRDIKPENVMLGEFGETVVLDWGIAKLKELDQPHSVQSEPPPPPSDGLRTAVGTLVGTPAYMSPEQALGHVDQVDERSDVWSLGAVLYELLTGEPLVGRGGPQAMLGAILAGRFRPPLEVDDSIPRELAAICTRALRRNPEDRYAGARELARELESFQSGARVGAYSYSSWELLARFARRNKALLSAATTVFVLALVAAAVSWASYRKEVRAHRIAQYHMAQALMEKAQALNAQADHTSAAIYAAASMLQNPANPFGPNYDRQFASNVPESGVTWTDALSNLYRAKLGSRMRLHRRWLFDEDVGEISLSPDASRCLVGGTAGTVDVFDVESGERRLHNKVHASAVFTTAFATDQRLVASGGYDGIRVWDSFTGETRIALSGHTREVRGLVFTRDGATLYSSSDDGTIRRWDLATGTERGVLEGHRSGVMCLALTPDASRLASGSRDGEVRLWSVATGALLSVRKVHSDVTSDLAFGADGVTLLSGSWDGSVARSSGTDLKEREAPFKNEAWVTGVRFMRSGGWVATLDLADDLRITESASGTRVLTLPAFSRGVQNLAASAEKDIVVFPAATRAVEVWRGNAGPDLSLMGLHRGFIQSLDFSPDGTLIVSASYDRTARVWDAATGAVLYELGGFSDYVQFASFSPDGHWVGALSRDGSLLLWDARARQEYHRLRGLCLANKFGWSPDSARIVVGGGDDRLWLFDVQSKTVLKRTSTAFPTNAGPAFIDGHTILMDPFGGATPLQLLDLETGTSRALTLPGGRRSHLWVPSRHSILWTSQDGRVAMFDLQSGQHVQLGELVGEILRVSDDGRYAFLAEGRNLVVHDIARKERLLRIPMAEPVELVAVAPDGRQVVLSKRNMLMRLPFDPASIATMSASPAAQLAESEAIAGRHLEGFELRPVELRR